MLWKGGPKSKILTYSTMEKIGRHPNTSVHFNKAFYSQRYLLKVSLAGCIGLTVLPDITLLVQW